jgi:hypothetical protein
MEVSGRLHAPSALPLANTPRFASDRVGLNAMKKKKKKNVYPFPGIEIGRTVLGRPMHGWNNNTEMDLKEIG